MLLNSACSIENNAISGDKVAFYTNLLLSIREVLYYLLFLLLIFYRNPNLFIYACVKL